MIVFDYGIQTGDDEDIPDYALRDLFDEGIQPEQNKQLVPKPLTYEESLADGLEGIKLRNKCMLILNIYLQNNKICLQNMIMMKFPTMLWMKKILRINTILKELEITDYDYVEKIVNEPEMTTQKISTFLNNKVLSLQSSGEIS